MYPPPPPTLPEQMTVGCAYMSGGQKKMKFGKSARLLLGHS